MFFTIYSRELRYWLRNPSVWLYALVLLLLSAGTMAAAAGAFDDVPVAATRTANGPMGLFSMAAFFTKLLLLLLPGIVGHSIYRDYKSNIDKVLYSYPFTKPAYLLGKFWSAFTIVGLLALCVGLGLAGGAALPGVPAASVAPFDGGVYAQLYAVYILPNLWLFSCFVFAVVVFSRNVYAGFITVLLLGIAREAVARLAVDGGMAGMLLEPLGESATYFYTKSRTIAEQQTGPLPRGEAILYNRLFWLAVAAGVFGAAYRFFSFSRQGFVPFWNKAGSARVTKDNFGSIVRLNLTPATHRYTFFQQLRVAWRLSGVDFRHIVRSGSFLSLLIAGSLFVGVLLLQMNPKYGTRLLPLTWVMLAFPVFFFSFLIKLMTFLYAGMLVHRERTTRMNALVDAAPVPEWSLLLSKVLALLKMQALLLAVVLVAGMAVQAYRGFDRFEVGHYLFDLYAVHWIGFAIWAFAAVFVQTLVTNPYLGLFALIVGALGITELPQLGITDLVFRFNEDPDPGFFLKYSDLSGYGHALSPHFVYKTYWLLAGFVLFCLAWLLWPRGLAQPFGARLKQAFSRVKGPAGVGLTLSLAAFAGMGAWIFQTSRAAGRVPTEAEIAAIGAAADKKYAHLAGAAQPRITAIEIRADIFPETQTFRSTGIYTLHNKTARPLDTLLIQAAFEVGTRYDFDRPVRVLHRDSAARFDILQLETPLLPGDSLHMRFDLESLPNTWLYNNSPVERNGTFITSLVCPGLGYRPWRAAAQSPDSASLANHYRAIDADFVDFDAVVGTSADQIALAPGLLEKEWMENGRRYFHYRSAGKVSSDFVLASGRYAVRREDWQGIRLQIFYHPGHEFNLEHMLAGAKAAIAYHEEYFGPYQHRQLSILEFSKAQGDFAQSFANTIPWSEIGFVLDAGDERGLNLPFAGASHEVSHQWWGHQATPADAPGARMVTESMAEYVSLQTLEHTFGPVYGQLFRKKALDIYLKRRAADAGPEAPLVRNTGLDKSYIPYQKGSLALYALSDQIGEARLNAALKAYLDRVKFQTAPYTTSLEMLDFIRRATPDSMQYLIRDGFETVTFYDNRLLKAQVTPLQNDEYQVDLEFSIQKYRLNSQGEKVYEDLPGTALHDPATGLSSLPLNDFVEVAVFSENQRKGGCFEGALYREKRRITRINNTLRVVVRGKPAEAGVDPFVTLIDASPADNRQLLQGF